MAAVHDRQYLHTLFPRLGAFMRLLVLCQVVTSHEPLVASIAYELLLTL